MGRYCRITYFSEATIAFGKQIGQLLCPGDFVFCFGELGVGKTELIRGIAQGFCGNEISEIVASPSFNYVYTYEVEGKCVHHFDLYRINDVKQVFSLGFNELFFSDAVCCIEWPELLIDVIQQKILQIELVIGHDFSRKIVLKTDLFRKNIDLGHILG